MTKTHAAAHHHIQTIQRSAGRSAVAAAAYRHNARMIDERTGLKHNYARKGDLIAEGVVGWSDTTSALWNAAEQSENRKNSITAREIVLALPHELDLATQERLIRGHCLMMRERYKVACSWVIHDPKNGENRNTHAHIMITSREVDQDGTFGKKTRILDDKKTGSKEFEHMRTSWAKRVNTALEKAGVAERVDHRSHARRAEAKEAPAQEPERHMGPKMTAIARKHKAATKAAKDEGKPAPTPPHFIIEAKRIKKRNAALWGLWNAHEKLKEAANSNHDIRDKSDLITPEAIAETDRLFEAALSSGVMAYRIADARRRKKEREDKLQAQARTNRPPNRPEGGSVVQMKHPSQRAPLSIAQPSTDNLTHAALAKQKAEPETAKNVVLLKTPQSQKPPKEESNLVQALKAGLAKQDQESEQKRPKQLGLFDVLNNQNEHHQPVPEQSSKDTRKQSSSWAKAQEELKNIFAKPDHASSKDRPSKSDVQKTQQPEQGQLFESLPEKSIPEKPAVLDDVGHSAPHKQHDEEHTAEEKAALIEMAAKSMLPPDGQPPRWEGRPLPKEAPPILRPKKEWTRGPPQK